MDSSQLQSLALKVEDLIQLCQALDRENRILKREAGRWKKEREQLIEKTEQARNKVEAMITRLKSLEQES